MYEYLAGDEIKKAPWKESFSDSLYAINPHIEFSVLNCFMCNRDGPSFVSQKHATAPPCGSTHGLHWTVMWMQHT